jgi:hypothetical protein
MDKYEIRIGEIQIERGVVGLDRVKVVGGMGQEREGSTIEMYVISFIGAIVKAYRGRGVEISYREEERKSGKQMYKIIQRSEKVITEAMMGIKRQVEKESREKR